MPDVPGGYFGRALVVDVTDGSAEELPLDEKTLRRYVGGGGLGTYLMHRLAPVDGDGARVHDAADLWGLPAAEAEERLRERLGPAWRVASIGPAGERLVRYATVSHDGRHAGRGGLGAVLASKGIKAVAVRAAMKCATADPERVLAAARDLRKRSFGPATAKYRELGTLANLQAFNAISTLPTRNFTAATFEEAPRLAA